MSDDILKRLTETLEERKSAPPDSSYNPKSAGVVRSAAGDCGAGRDRVESAVRGRSTMTILCLASYFKGREFLREARRQGCRVLLVTSESLRDAEWPREAVDEMFFVPDVRHQWKIEDLLLGVSHVARREALDRIVPLDDFDLEKASALREHLRVAGMGETTTRYFRDKLAMRVKAGGDGVPVPAFVHVLNEARIRAFTSSVPPPWFLKPRQQAGAIGIRRIRSGDELWAAVAELGDRSSAYLLERAVSGDVYHVDSIVYDREVRFAVASRYGTPPFEVSHGGGVFTSSLVERGSAEERALLDLNGRLLASLGLVRGVWREVIGDEPEALPAYSSSWAEAAGEEMLARGGQRRATHH